MREIKFRAWDNEKKCWYEPIHEAYKGNLFELLVGFHGDLSAHTIQGLAHQSMWPDRFELMQFTGLLDKNGKEIYEGDILRLLETISSDDPAYPYYCETMEVVFSEANISFGLTDGGAFLPIRGQVEVIGNIYENPELCG